MEGRTRGKFISLLEEKIPEIKCFDEYLAGGISLKARMRRFLFSLRRYKFRGFYYFTWFFPMVLRVKSFWNKSIYVDLPEDISVLFFGALPGFELPLTKFLIKTLQSDSVFYDIGAHIGFYTSLAQEFITSGQVHSFEPNPQTFRVLSKNIFSSSVFANQLAVFSDVGDKVFYADLRKMSGMSGFGFHRRFNKIFVKATTLDNYVLTHRPPTMIKIDAEGAESEIVMGAREMLGAFHPTIIMEIWKDPNKKEELPTIDLLFNLGYLLYGINGNGDLELLTKVDQGANLGFDNFVFKFS